MEFLIIIWALSLGSLSRSQISFPGFGGSGGVPFPVGPPNITPRPHQPQGNEELTGCNCLPASKCPNGFGQLQIACVLETGGNGVCCIPQQGVALNRLGFTNSGGGSKSFSDNAISKSYQSGLDATNSFNEDVRRRLADGQYLKQGTPERGHAYFFQRSPSAIQTHQSAYVLAQTSLLLAQSESLTPQQSFFGLANVKIGNNLRSFQCAANVGSRCDASAKYRTIDGSCNNHGNTDWGRSETGFGRLSPPLYNDGIMAPRTVGVDGRPLPSPRLPSNNVLLDVDVPDTDFSLAVMQWAQFIDHDLSLAPFPDMNGQAIMCCQNGQRVNPLPEGCFPIDIPLNDGFYGPRGQRCLNFVRSMLALNDNCALGPVEQMNVLTSWIDGSMIYGSTERTHGAVVDRTTGFMRTSANNLPPVNSTMDCAARDPSAPCFVAGDGRINEQPGLTTLHVIWVREHNRIARILQQLNSQWDANRLFEETRRIVIAEVQLITYREWLPILIGESNMRRFGITVLGGGHRTDYDPNSKPNIFTEFATAAFRFGHSTVQGLFKLILASGRQSTARLRDVFNAPHIINRNPEMVDAFVRSLTTQTIQTLDNFITTELSNHLFQTPQFNFGMDLMSLNVQRGRDHAIATYNQMRPIFGFRRANSFFDLIDHISPALVARIQTVYRNVDDIDLWVGGISETHLPDAILGPIFASIVAKQFAVLQKGDRFFYDLAGQPGSFTPDQLQELRKASMAKVFCDNTNVKEMQPLAFKSVNPLNPRLPCHMIHGIDLTKFR